MAVMSGEDFGAYQRPESASRAAQRPLRRKIGQQTEEIAMQCANQDLNHLRQPNTLPVRPVREGIREISVKTTWTSASLYSNWTGPAGDVV